MNINFQSRFSAQWNTPFRCEPSSPSKIGTTSTPLFGHRTTLSGYIFATKARTDNRKNVRQQYLPTMSCSHNVMNFGPLTAEIGSGVWGTPANFNGSLVLAALLRGTLVVGVSQTFAALNRGRHLYSAGRPSRWALAHISSCEYCTHS